MLRQNRSPDRSLSRRASVAAARLAVAGRLAFGLFALLRVVSQLGCSVEPVARFIGSQRRLQPRTGHRTPECGLDGAPGFA